MPQKSGRETGAWQSPASEREGYTRKALAEELLDPDKVTPLKSETQSQDYLSKPANKGE